MEGSGWFRLSKGLLSSALYCAGYWCLWQASFDQWFLPAGLRVTAFLLVPLRYWPFLLLGDATALLMIRSPMVEDYGPIWSYLSPFLLAPWVTSAIFLFRKKLRTPERQASWLPLVGIILALWGVLGNVTINTLLSGPPSFDTLGKAFNFAIGNYLGIILLALPAYFFATGKHRNVKGTSFIRDAVIALAVVIVLYVSLTVEMGIAPSTKQILLMLMFLPAAWLMLMHGWRGAAAGICMVNLAIAQTMTYTGEQGTKDYDVYLIQVGLTIAASIILVIGTKISTLYDRARQLGISEQRAQAMTRSSLLVGEGSLREQVLYMAQMHVYMDDQRKQLVELLKSQGKFTDAMLLNSAAVEHMQSFESRARAIYPLGIEEEGLYKVIFPETFTDFWAGDAEVLYLHAVGMPRILSVELQLTAYRCICNAFTVLAQNRPYRYTVKLKTWKRGRYRGIAFKITALSDQPPQLTQSGAMAEVDLERRVKAFGGTLGRRRLDCVRVLLWESVSQDPSPTAIASTTSER